ncbi:MAG: hypothetical protein EHM85_03810 [Desulfobacteraceae bacterium]|nr:MAG: hypothetical protein EHM85_03810 [Desulfobacteraceae bacterium]
MSIRTVNPAFVVPGVSVDTLQRLPRVHTKFDERFLQDLLADHPELLPVRDIRDDVGSLLCIGREVAVSSGAIDNLYLSTQGYPVIVETKLWRNPQARREVLSQTLDYIKEVVQKDFEWFAQQWKLFSQQHDNQTGDLPSRLNDLSDDEIDEQFIVDRVNRALSRGDVVAIIVGDGIETRLQELVAHLCRDSSHLRYSLALVELACYQFENQDRDGIIVVPRIIHDVEPVQRAYVRVDLANELERQLTVTPVVVTDRDGPKPPRVNLNEDDFLDAIEQSAGRQCRDQIYQFYSDLIDSFNLEPEFKAAAVMLKVPHPDGDGMGTSILALEKQGRIYNTKHMSHQLKRWGLSLTVIEQITSDYWTALHNIDLRFNPAGIVHLAPRQFLPFAEIVDKLSDIKDRVGKVVAEIRSAYENAR